MFDHAPPDLTTRAGRKAYRHDLRMVAVRPRRYGLWLLTSGVLLMLMPSAFGIHAIFGWSPSVLGISACCAAVPLLGLGIVLRKRYHRGRMRPPCAPPPGDAPL